MTAERRDFYSIGRKRKKNLLLRNLGSDKAAFVPRVLRSRSSQKLPDTEMQSACQRTADRWNPLSRKHLCFLKATGALAWTAQSYAAWSNLNSRKAPPDFSGGGGRVLFR